MLWKSRWTGDWFLGKAADQPNRARIQDNRILISAYDEILSKTFDCYCLMTGELPVPELPQSRTPRRNGFGREAEQTSFRSRVDFRSDVVFVAVAVLHGLRPVCRWVLLGLCHWICGFVTGFVTWV
jgi:hypothetical protein